MEVGQAYVLNTFDFGGVKALPLISKFPDKYKKHVIIPGAVPHKDGLFGHDDR